MDSSLFSHRDTPIHLYRSIRILTHQYLSMELTSVLPQPFQFYCPPLLVRSRTESQIFIHLTPIRPVPFLFTQSHSSLLPNSLLPWPTHPLPPLPRQTTLREVFTIVISPHRFPFRTTTTYPYPPFPTPPFPVPPPSHPSPTLPFPPKSAMDVFHLIA